jgi:FkbM family methyltransferase
MTIISYAQNFEDIMLWRALGHVSGGFWIDVGAADPDTHSVTRVFSERGWCGVNIEPTRVLFERLAAARPREINLNVAVAARPGRMIFYECADATLSSLDPATAERNRADGRAVTERTIKVTTLAKVCRAHARGEIHFLKIDVEGAEAEVLAGADFTVFRPWIIVIEATRPLTEIDASTGWEPALLAAAYRFAWFDGINRFYISEERWDALSVHFRAPPNMFDDFVQYDPGDRVHAELALAQARIELLRTENAALRENCTLRGMLRRALQPIRRQARP